MLSVRFFTAHFLFGLFLGDFLVCFVKVKTKFHDVFQCVLLLSTLSLRRIRRSNDQALQLQARSALLCSALARITLVELWTSYSYAL